MSSQGPRFLFAISVILRLKNDLLVFFTVLWKDFQSSRLFKDLYLLRSLLQLLSHQLLECLVMLVSFVICKSTHPKITSPQSNHTSLPSTVATFLTTCLMAVLQPSGYSVFHIGDTPIQLGLPWRSYSCQCLNTETSARGNRSFTTETLSISYTFCLYIRLVVTL